MSDASETRSEWLPQYADAIPAARERLKTPTVKTREWDGAARLDVRTVEELRKVSKTVGAMKEGDEDDEDTLGTKIMG
ncbi:MAG: hypothetical protein P8X69_10375 [Maritimibacter sp.]